MYSGPFRWILPSFLEPASLFEMQVLELKKVKLKKKTLVLLEIELHSEQKQVELFSVQSNFGVIYERNFGVIFIDYASFIKRWVSLEAPLNRPPRWSFYVNPHPVRRVILQTRMFAVGR